jgi:hypothetical protein
MPCLGLRLRGFDLVRWATVLALTLSLAGCFASNSPTISKSSAEDVGKMIQYRTWGSGDVIRLVRRSGAEYQLQLVDRENPNGSGTPFANGVSIRQLGRRGNAKMYLVQFDLARFDLDPDIRPASQGFSYFSYVVAIDRAGKGIVAVFDCDREEVLVRGRDSGLDIRCKDLPDQTIPFVANRASDQTIRSFVKTLLRDGFMKWEDETKQGVLDWVE